MSNNKQVKIKLVRSINSASVYQKECVKGLGLRRMHHEVLRADTPTTRGLIAKISYMLQVEEA